MKPSVTSKILAVWLVVGCVCTDIYTTKHRSPSLPLWALFLLFLFGFGLWFRRWKFGLVTLSAREQSPYSFLGGWLVGDLQYQACDPAPAQPAPMPQCRPRNSGTPASIPAAPPQCASSPRRTESPYTLSAGNPCEADVHRIHNPS